MLKTCVAFLKIVCLWGNQKRKVMKNKQAVEGKVYDVLGVKVVFKKEVMCPLCCFFNKDDMDNKTDRKMCNASPKCGMGHFELVNDKNEKL